MEGEGGLCTDLRGVAASRLPVAADSLSAPPRPRGRTSASSSCLVGPAREEDGHVEDGGEVKHDLLQSAVHQDLLDRQRRVALRVELGPLNRAHRIHVGSAVGLYTATISRTRYNTLTVNNWVHANRSPFANR